METLEHEDALEGSCQLPSAAENAKNWDLTETLLGVLFDSTLGSSAGDGSRLTSGTIRTEDKGTNVEKKQPPR